MELSLTRDTLFITLSTSLLVLYYLVLIITRRPRTTTKNQEPPLPPIAGGAWPLIGHVHLLGGSKPTHQILADMADKYGPIFTIKVGVQEALVVSSSEMAKECFITNDVVFANRPRFIAGEIMGYDSVMFGLRPYGPFWRQIRKIATQELLSNQRLETYKEVREKEARTATKELYKLWEVNKERPVLVEMKRWFADMTLNVIFHIIVGKRVGYNSRDCEWKGGVREFFHLFQTVPVGDVLPFLRWLDIGGTEKGMKKTAKKLDVVVTEWLNEHKEIKKQNDDNQSREDDFMSLMLDYINDSDKVYGFDLDTIRKATCMGLIVAGSDSTSVVSTWALSLLLNHPDAMKEAQRELDEHVGKERRVQESDCKNLNYLLAIIKETLRLYPSPLGFPHESKGDCVVGGYRIPSGTRLLCNLWKIHRDPCVWHDPLEFRPERFLTTHKDFNFKGLDCAYFPFGSGRRMCPGVTFAIQVVQLNLATLLHGFDFATPTGEPVDMIESGRFDNIRLTPLEVVITPRLSSYLYK